MEDDFLADMVMQDERIYNEGRLAGKVEGRNKSKVTSFLEGFKNGLEICGEVQYFYSWAQTLDTLLSSSLENKSSNLTAKEAKVKMAIKELHKLISICEDWGDIVDPKSEELKVGIENIHKSMNKVWSLLGLSSTKAESIMDW